MLSDRPSRRLPKRETRATCLHLGGWRGKVRAVSDTFRRTRGPASQKFTRARATGQAEKQREQFGKTWGTFNAQAAKQLRKGSA